MLSSLHLQAPSPVSTPCSDASLPSPTEKTRRVKRGGRRGGGRVVHGRGASSSLRPDEENGLLEVHSGDEDDEGDREHLGAQALYSSWIPATQDRDSLSAWLYSFCFAAASITINLLLVIFLVYARSMTHCLDMPSAQDALQPPTNSMNTIDLRVGGTPPRFTTPTEQTSYKYQPAPMPVPNPNPITPVAEPITEAPHNEAQNPDSVMSSPLSVPVAQPTPMPPNPAAPAAQPSTVPAAPISLPSAPVAAGPVVPPSGDVSSPASSSLLPSAVEFQSSFDVSRDHRFTWSFCAADFALDPRVDYKQTVMGAPPAKFCPETLTNEQHYQLSWFGAHVAVGYTLPQRFVPPFLDCVHLPPTGYQWPEKHAKLPCTNPVGAVNWPNLRVRAHDELIEFNRGTPKNLYHFDAPQYDLDGLEELALAAKYIPLKAKVRNMLDIGAGGGSFGVLLKAKYDIQTIASAFADWPYCEYMTERGELCLLLDVMEAMPFAKFSFDMIHISWVYHGQAPNELWAFVHEADRILRPGGYLYMRGGWSNSQITAQRSMLSNLGYTLLYESLNHKPPSLTEKVSFGPNLPYHADWTAIYVKPIRARMADEAVCAARRATQGKGRLVLPLPVRQVPTQEGNVYAAPATSQ